MEFDLIDGICCQKQNGAMIFFKNGEQEFFYSIPRDLSEKVAEEDCNDFLAAKGLLKANPPMTQME